MPPPIPRPIALSIAGSDSGGGAGIQADLKTFEAFGVFGTTAITAVTAQNTLGVEAAVTLDPAIVTAQIHAVAVDLPPAATKTGMLSTATLVSAVATAIQDLAISPLVLDPVMVSSTGHRLLDRDGIEVILTELLPVATLVTPNIEEAELLTGLEIASEQAALEAAHRLVAAGAGAALVKGGHLKGAEIVDVLWDGETETVWRAQRIDREDTHGTGCTLSAAIAAGLALDEPLRAAVGNAIAYTRRAIESAPGLGRGRGPLDHRAARQG